MKKKMKNKITFCLFTHFCHEFFFSKQNFSVNVYGKQTSKQTICVSNMAI